MRNSYGLKPNQILVDSIKKPSVQLRICWLDQKRSEIGLISLSDPLGNPYTASLKDVLRRVSSGELQIVSNLERAVEVCTEEYRRKYMTRAKRLYETIAPYFREHIRALFCNRTRGKVIRALVEKLSLSRPTLMKHLRAFFKNGMSLNTFLPNYKNCGARGKERKPRRKPGRKVLPKNQNSHSDGMLLSVDHKAQLKKGWMKYRIKQRFTLHEAYERTCEEHFFHKIVERDNHYHNLVIPGELKPRYCQKWCTASGGIPV